MDTIRRIQRRVESYGLINTVVTVLKHLGRRIFSLSYDKMYLLSTDPSKSSYSKNLLGSVTLKQLCLDDFDNKLWRQYYLTNNKKTIYEERFKDRKATAYGLLLGGQLACVAWLYDGELLVGGKIHIKVNPNTVLFFDAFTHPLFRRRGLHHLMNLYRLDIAKKMGKECCYTIVASYNKPSLDSMQKCGFEIVKKFRLFQFRKYIHCSLVETGF